MTIYNYDKDGIFVGASEAKESPREVGVFRIPAFSTTIEPPQLDEGQSAQWVNDQWEITEDHRGVGFWFPEDYEKEKAPYKIDEVGPLPEGASLVQPNEPQEVTDAKALEKAEREAKKIADALADAEEALQMAQELAVRDRAVAIEAIFMAMDVAERIKVFDLQDKIVRCMHNEDEEMALALADTLKPDSLKDQVLAIINA